MVDKAGLTLLVLTVSTLIGCTLASPLVLFFCLVFCFSAFVIEPESKLKAAFKLKSSLIYANTYYSFLSAHDETGYEACLPASLLILF